MTMDGPRDPDTTWTFVDVRDHYLCQLYSVDPTRLRAEDPCRYAVLSMATTADLMEAVLSEWRRPRSSCAGALVWQLQDLVPGSGWGVIDSGGHPKAAWHGLRRVLAPVQILLSDEGVNGLELHVINETSEIISATIDLRCINGRSNLTLAVNHDLTLQARESRSISIYSICKYFFDATRAYRFGTDGHSVTAAGLHCPSTGNMLSQAFHFPLGRNLPLEDVGLTCNAYRVDDIWMAEVSTARFAQSVHFQVSGYRGDPDWFHLLPSQRRLVKLYPVEGSDLPPTGIISALNSRTSVPVGINP